MAVFSRFIFKMITVSFYDTDTIEFLELKLEFRGKEEFHISSYECKTGWDGI